MSARKPRRFVAYSRVATTERLQPQHSLAAQQKRLRQWAARHGVSLVDEIADDGRAGRTLTRPGLQRALELLQAGLVDGLVVTGLDRLTRRARDLLDIVQRLDKRQRSLVSIHEKLDTTTPPGKLVATVLREMATWDKKAGSDEGARQERPKFATAKDRQRTLERIKVLVQRKLTLKEIAEQLDKGGHPTKGGGRWQARMVKEILERDRRRRTRRR